MENEISNSNPNVKNVATPAAAPAAPVYDPQIFPPNTQFPGQPVPQQPMQGQMPQMPQQAQQVPVIQNTQTMRNLSPVDQIRRTTDRTKKPVVPKSAAAQQKEKDKGKDKEKDQIRIVIRDAKPPILARILQAVMRVLCFVLIVAVCGIGVPKLFGINEFNVLTGSMTPTYPIGTLVFVQPKDPNTIRPGEVVTVIMNENLDMVTHRVTENNYDKKTLTTKGDANNSEDAPSLYENVVGVVVFAVPYAGGVVDYITNDQQGRIIGIGIVLSILALTFIAEGICYLLTKQSANIFQSNQQKKKNYQMKNINARKFNKEYKRGKGQKIPPAPPKQGGNKPKS